MTLSSRLDLWVHYTWPVTALHFKTCSLVVSNLRSETKGSWFKSSCYYQRWVLCSYCLANAYMSKKQQVVVIVRSLTINYLPSPLQSCDLRIFMIENPARKKQKQKKNPKNKTKTKGEISSFPAIIHSAIVHTIIVWLLPFQIIILIQVLGEGIFDYNCDWQLQNTDLNNVWNRGICQKQIFHPFAQ